MDIIILEYDLKEILSFVEPAPENYKTYSHRLYSLLVRACTEFEANCKAILIENDLKFPKKSDINTYWSIHNILGYKSINDYQIELLFLEEILTPLANWKEEKGLGWYQDYNKVKVESAIHSQYNS